MCRQPIAALFDNLFDVHPESVIAVEIAAPFTAGSELHVAALAAPNACAGRSWHIPCGDDCHAQSQVQMAHSGMALAGDFVALRLPDWRAGFQYANPGAGRERRAFGE
jgi:hypothetical protein